jgi:hypothetical protein
MPVQAGPFYLSGTNQEAQISTQGLTTVGISVTGTFSATLQPGVTVGPSAAANTFVIPSTSQGTQSTITGTGDFTVNVAGYTTFQLNTATWSSGTAVVYLQG